MIIKKGLVVLGGLPPYPVSNSNSYWALCVPLTLSSRHPTAAALGGQRRAAAPSVPPRACSDSVRHIVCRSRSALTLHSVGGQCRAAAPSVPPRARSDSVRHIACRLRSARSSQATQLSSSASLESLPVSVEPPVEASSVSSHRSLAQSASA